MRYLNTINAEIKFNESKVTELHKLRSSLFDKDEKEYWKVNKELNSYRKMLQNSYDERAEIKSFFHGKEYLPKNNERTGKTYLRYETLPNNIANKIYRTWINGKWIYGVKETPYIGRTLKDIYGYLKNRV